ncbi:MAG: DNA repair exonuclease [Firmicutes bacterium]|nr:DNA repair exonuclease [Bacillota bacterium]
MFRFVHCADLHLDSPLRGLAAKDGAPIEAIRGATRKALENLVRLCITEKVAFLVIAGDIYDGDWEDYSTGLFFYSQMVRLREHGIAVFLIRGNHDAASQITRRLSLPDNVVEFPVDRPETAYVEACKVAIHGQGFASRAVTEDLSQRYPQPVPGYFNIGLLHTCAEGREGHEAYAPCSVANLIAKGYDYWALGHIHKREILAERPWIVFPGNLQGRHIRETGSKGCTVVTVDGREVSLEHRALDVLRWCPCDVDVEGVETTEDALSRIEAELWMLADEHAGYPLAVRVTLTGETILHETFMGDPEQLDSEVRALTLLVAGDRMWLEKVQISTFAPLSHTESQLPEDAMSRLLLALRELTDDESFLQSFATELAGAQKHLRTYMQSPGALPISSSEDVRAVARDAEAILLSALTKAGRRI